MLAVCLIGNAFKRVWKIKISQSQCKPPESHVNSLVLKLTINHVMELTKTSKTLWTQPHLHSQCELSNLFIQMLRSLLTSHPGKGMEQYKSAQIAASKIPLCSFGTCEYMEVEKLLCMTLQLKVCHFRKNLGVNSRQDCDSTTQPAASTTSTSAVREDALQSPPSYAPAKTQNIVTESARSVQSVRDMDTTSTPEPSNLQATSMVDEADRLQTGKNSEKTPVAGQPGSSQGRRKTWNSNISIRHTGHEAANNMNNLIINEQQLQDILSYYNGPRQQQPHRMSQTNLVGNDIHQESVDNGCTLQPVTSYYRQQMALGTLYSSVRPTIPPVCNNGVAESAQDYNQCMPNTTTDTVGAPPHRPHPSQEWNSHTSHTGQNSNNCPPMVEQPPHISQVNSTVLTQDRTHTSTIFEDTTINHDVSVSNTTSAVQVYPAMTPLLGNVSSANLSQISNQEIFTALRQDSRQHENRDTRGIIILLLFSIKIHLFSYW